MKNRRVMLKLSGEALAGDKHMGFDEATVTEVAREVKGAYDEGVEQLQSAIQALKEAESGQMLMTPSGELLDTGVAVN